MSDIYGPSGTGDEHEILFTFDDGPHLTNTPVLLDVLREFGIKAVFFVVGSNLSKHEYIDIVHKAHEEGHTIGNHSFTHADLTKLDENGIKDEIIKTENYIKDVFDDVKLFRPPYGAHNKIVDKILSDFGYTIKLWNVDPQDWNKKFQPIAWIDNAMSQILSRHNCTVLNHDIHSSTVNHFKEFVVKLQENAKMKFISY
jgi:peptidoglycan/xylan/chitin deacetylase (PgdA/CDA1 family)